MNAMNPRSRMRKGRLFLLSLRVAVERVSLWSTATFIIALGALVLAFPWHAWFAGLDGHRFQMGEQVASLTEIFRQDHASGLAQLNKGTAASGAVLALIAWLFGIFLAGGWLQVILERSHGQVLRRFCVGGARHFLRFLRLSLLLLLILGLIGWVLYGAPFDGLVLRKFFSLPASDLSGSQRMESLGSEATRDQILWVRDGLMTIAFVLVMVWGVYTRARIAVSGSRSVLAAGGMTALSMLRYPLRTFAPQFGLLLVEMFLLLAVIGPAARWANGSLQEAPESAFWIWMLLVLGLLGLALREIIRGARYHAAVVVSKATIRSSHHTDPWQSIGAPGGPQYPVNEADDDGFGVSL